MSAENVNVTLLKTRTYALLQEQTFVYNRTKSKKRKVEVHLIKDRGTIKWAAMMLPEHVHELRELWEKDKEVAERTIDEQKIELIDYAIKSALTSHMEVKITFYEGRTYIEKLGHIREIDPYTSILSLLTPQGQKLKIQINRIVDVEPTE